MSLDWNMSLFHYRNHIPDYGCIVVEIQVHSDGRPEWQAFLDTLGFPYYNESENPADKSLTH
jgi:threonine dehydratase